MNKYIIKIEGMMCGMCETHVNDVFRRNFKIKKVSSSHFKNEAIVIPPEEVTEVVINAYPYFTCILCSETRSETATSIYRI